MDRLYLVDLGRSVHHAAVGGAHRGYQTRFGPARARSVEQQPGERPLLAHDLLGRLGGWRNRFLLALLDHRRQRHRRQTVLAGQRLLQDDLGLHPAVRQFGADLLLLVVGHLQSLLLLLRDSLDLLSLLLQRLSPSGRHLQSRLLQLLPGQFLGLLLRLFLRGSHHYHLDLDLASGEVDLALGDLILFRRFGSYRLQRVASGRFFHRPERLQQGLALLGPGARQFAVAAHPVPSRPLLHGRELGERLAFLLPESSELVFVGPRRSAPHRRRQSHRTQDHRQIDRRSHWYHPCLQTSGSGPPANPAACASGTLSAW